MTTPIVSLTEKAGAKLKDVLLSEGKASYGLRVYVEGGGCSGFQYGLSFEESASEEDAVIEAHGVHVFVDPYSEPMLQGMLLDFNDGLNGAGFVFKNPNAKSTCGCGNSFN